MSLADGKHALSMLDRRITRPAVRKPRHTSGRIQAECQFPYIIHRRAFPFFEKTALRFRIKFPHNNKPRCIGHFQSLSTVDIIRLILSCMKLLMNIVPAMRTPFTNRLFPMAILVSNSIRHSTINEHKRKPMKCIEWKRRKFNNQHLPLNGLSP